MVGGLSLQEALALLPREIRDLVKDLPANEASQVIEKLLVQRDIDFRALDEADLASIKARTADKCEFGFQSVDVDLTWEELGRPNYIGLGAFAEQEGGQVPVAFVVAEICKRPRGEKTEAEQPIAGARGWPGAAHGGSAQASSSSGRLPAARLGSSEPLRASPRELAAAMRAAGCGGTRDVAAAIWYIGVSYEYRRQGLGSQLIDLVREVAEQAGCKSLLLHVAEYNPNAIAFYTRYGFTAVPEVYKQGERGRHTLMHLPLAPEPAPGGGAPAQEGAAHGELREEEMAGAGAAVGPNRGFGAGGGGGSGRKKGKGGKGGKRRALPQPSEDPGGGWACGPPLAVEVPAAGWARGSVHGGGAHHRCRFGPSRVAAAAATAAAVGAAAAGSPVPLVRASGGSGAGAAQGVGTRLVACGCHVTRTGRLGGSSPVGLGRRSFGGPSLYRLAVRGALRAAAGGAVWR